MVASAALADEVLPPLRRVLEPGNTKPILVSMSGLTGEAAATLRFDLYVQGFAFTNAEAAQYLISGSNNGNLQARATDPSQQEHAGLQGLFRRVAAAAGACVCG